jgi:pyruvate carboxylase subunit B
MKFYVGNEARTLEIDIVESEGRVVARYDGRELPIDLEKLQGGDSYSLLVNGRSHRFSARREGEGCVVRFGGRSYRMNVETERDRVVRATRKHRGVASGPREVRSDMAGIVVKVLVEVGTSVQAGDPLVIIEAMKMENEIRAPGPGTVDRIHVAERSTVLVGAPLLTLQE